MALPLTRIMSTAVEILEPDATLEEAVRRMRRHQIGMLPRCDGTRILGTVTDRDITVRATASGSDPRTARVSTVMSEDVRCCNAEDDLLSVVQQMREHQLRRLPVLDGQRNLGGMISLADVARHSEECTAGDRPARHLSPVRQR